MTTKRNLTVARLQLFKYSLPHRRPIPHLLLIQSVHFSVNQTLPFISSSLLRSLPKMVSKLAKKIHRPSKKSHKKSSPKKPITSSSIRRSFRVCRTKLLKLFTHIAVNLSSSNHKNNGFQRLTPLPQHSNNPLPPSTNPSKKTVFLDLDETLIHSKTNPPPEKYDFIVYPSLDGEVIPFYVLKRPGVDEFLRKLSEKYEVVVFTAGLKEYATLVIDRLDAKREIFDHRLYRDSCTEMSGKSVKDLSDIGRDLNRVVIVDDNPGSYMMQVENALPVKAFVNDLEDKELGRIMKFFEVESEFEDIRDAVKSFLKGGGEERKELSLVE